MKFLQSMFLAAVTVLFFACNNNDSEQNNSSEASNNSEQEGAIEYLGNSKPKYNLYEGETTDEFKDASIDAWEYKDGKFSFDISGSSYELKQQTSDAESLMCANSDKGQHMHVILDKKPYSAQYEPSFDYKISNGQHHMLVFLGKSYHESIKNPKAHVARLIEVEDGNITHDWNIPDPSLFYSRPKGTYVGEEAKKILIDFYPVNIKIGEDAKIKLQINGEQYYLYEWKPYFVEGLPFGTNSIGIQLVDMNGMPLGTPVSSELREIELKRDPTAQAN